MIDGPARITREGHFVAKARVARANNVQDYRVGKGPGELDIADREPGSTVRIFRPESEIFAKDSLATALHRPVVIDHPGQDVNADNWKSLAVGDTGGDVLRDGDTMSVPIMVMDSAGVKAVQTTHPEFSWGYSGDLDLTPGKFGDAEYDGSLRNVRYNHLAMCGRARGGSDLRVTDSLVIVDERPNHQEQPMKIKIGDAEVDATNGEAVSVAVQALNKKLGDAETTVGTLTAENTTLKDANEKLTGENTALKQQVEDAKVTPEKLQQLADARAKVIADAKTVGGDKLVTDGKTDAEIRKDAVVARMGDAAKDLSDAAIEGAFAAYAVSDGEQTQRHTAPSGQPVSFGDAAARLADAQRKASEARRNAWKTPANSAAA